ncbi:hypothetical protein ESCO_003455 [Escovopsis weberi]|uniref:AB hydrolase-1 domain-containing protein n=1 Tax=Escovopsis weberi TaxID=150374 RepID=A0A0M8N0W6_ESCWE|nr:hypothetical protein ESCO_003455 [Escovopsis weberi]
MATAYVTKGLPPPPDVSLTTKPMAGLLVDIYGLAELASSSTPLTCLWLLHPRTQTRAHMGDFARRAVHAWNSSPSPSPARGLIALAFDMPCHGSRAAGEAATLAWGEGNAQHALDMAAMVRGGVRDMGAVMDLVGGYLGRRVEAHVCLGWSLGGHAAWQALFHEARIDAAVAVVGCPDYMGLMSDRGRESNLDLEGAPFFGSRYFPQDLVELCLRNDPKAMLFGAGDVAAPASEEEAARLRGVLDARVRGKKLLLCFGARDRLVPYENSRPLVDLLKDACAAGGWYADAGLAVTDKVYEGVGHRFSGDMVEDAVAFLMERVREGPRGDVKARI